MVLPSKCICEKAFFSTCGGKKSFAPGYFCMKPVSSQGDGGELCLVPQS